MNVVRIILIVIWRQMKMNKNKKIDDNEFWEELKSTYLEYLGSYE